MIDLHVDWTDAARAGRRIGHAIEAHEVIGSTNDRARELLAEGGADADGTVVVADAQTAGRGRHDRSWHSPAGSSLSMSAAIRPRLAAADAWQLALGAALAASEACDPFADTWLKWPNDLVTVDDRKLGGILIETLVEGDRVAGAIIGIGLNLDWRRDDMPEDLRHTAASLAEIARAPFDRLALLDRLMDRMSSEVEAIESGSWRMDRYRRRCRTLGAHVTVAVGESTISGRAVALDDDGALVVEAADGTRRLQSGEVTSVRRLSA